MPAITSADLPDEEHRTRHVGDEVQLLGADVNIAGQDVVGDDVLDERALVVLFLVVDLGAVERDVGHDAQAVRQLVVTLGEHGVVKVRAPVDERLEGLMIDCYDRIRRAVQADDRLRPFFADHGCVAARNDVAVRVDHADHTVGGLFHLNDHALEHTAGHGIALPIIMPFTQMSIDIILHFRHYCKRLLTFYFKTGRVFCAVLTVFRHLPQSVKRFFVNFACSAVKNRP